MTNKHQEDRLLSYANMAIASIPDLSSDINVAERDSINKIYDSHSSEYLLSVIDSSQNPYIIRLAKYKLVMLEEES